MKANQIKLGIDVHADSYVVVRQVDGQNPQPPQSFAPAEFLDWVRRQFTRAVTVHSCYEAGAFGYGLHRQLAELGVHNLVVAPQRLDERHTGVKTDQTDARALVLKLDSDEQGMGFIDSENDKEVTLKGMGGVKTVFKKAEIVSRTKLPNSLMPAGLNAALSTQDIVDLATFLSEQKKK